jgi:cell division inhibitor SulA
MQYQQQMPDRFQYPLLLPLGDASEPVDNTSELSLRGAVEHCLSLLGPVLRELSQAADARWLTLIAPPSPLTPAWLRSASLNRERILLLQARDQQSAFELTCEALRLGRSHTVVSWLPLSAQESRTLARAANEGCAQSLNIRMS